MTTPVRLRLLPLALLLMVALSLLMPAPASAAEQTVSPATLRQWVDSGRPHIVVDVRSEPLFNAAHLPGALSIPAQVLPHQPLPTDRDIVLYDNDLSGATVRAAAARLASVDAARLFLLQGGLRAWQSAGFEVVRPAGLYDPTLETLITAEDLREALRIGIPVRVLDLRDSKSFAAGTLPGAASVPLLRPAEELKNLRTDSLAAMVVLPETTTKKLRADAGGDHTAPSSDAVAAALAEQIATATRTKGKATGPVVVVDESGVLGRRVVPHLKRYGLGEALTLDAGYAGWKALQNPAPGLRQTIYHGGSSVSVPRPAGS